MKKLLKSKICRTVNSAQIHCSRKKSQNMRLKKRKKKKKKKREGKRAKRKRVVYPNRTNMYHLFRISAP